MSPAYLIWEQAQAELITGSAEPMAVEHRCVLADEALKWAAGSPFRINYVKRGILCAPMGQAVVRALLVN